MTKKLTATNYFDQKVVNANKKEVFFLDEEQTQSISYHPVFSKSKRTALLQELLSTVNFCNKNDIKHFSNEFEVLQYLEYLMVKYFTDIKDYFDVSSDDYYVNVDVMRKLYDIDFIDLMLNEAFRKEEMKKVYDEYNKAYERLEIVTQEIEKLTVKKQQEQNAQKLKEKQAKAVK